MKCSFRSTDRRTPKGTQPSPFVNADPPRLAREGGGSCAIRRLLQLRSSTPRRSVRRVAGVEAVDVGGVLLLDQVALDAELGGEEAVVDGELLRDHQQLLGHLVARETGEPPQRLALEQFLHPG